jgi:flagellar hook-associated protein 1 FlgK
MAFMASTFGGLETAKSGLSVSMQYLNVTEQNITNVNTPGYTRQRLLTSAKEPASSEYLIAQKYNSMIGQGVEALGVQQIRSEYLDQQYRTLNSSYTHLANRSQALTYLDGLYHELDKEGSLTTSIENYFKALNDFSGNTSSKALRTNVQQQALAMTQTFNTVYKEMESLWQDQNANIESAAQKINAIGQKLAELNEAIASGVRINGSANDLNDERNLLLDELAGYVNITYDLNDTDPNMVDVQIGGVSLVEGKTANQIEVNSIESLSKQIAQINSDIAAGTIAPSDGQTAINALVTQMDAFTAEPLVQTINGAGQVDVTYDGVALVTGTTAASMDSVAAGDLNVWIELNRNHINLGTDELQMDVEITGGQLYANMEMTLNSGEQNPGIPYYMDQLNKLARDIAKNINTIHQSGFTYPDPDSGLTSRNDVLFFDVDYTIDTVTGKKVVSDYSDVTAGNFTLSDEVLASVYNIAGASQEVQLGDDPTETGNMEIAEAMFKDLVNSGYYEKLNSIIGNLSITSYTSKGIMNTKGSLLKSVDAQRTSLSGVSLDEETTNLIVYQQSYNACSRVITTLDQMLDKMINDMGIVGR